MGWEGHRKSLYNDTNGFPTIGIGHKLTASEIRAHNYVNGITFAAMDTLFDIDIASIDAQVNSLFQEGTLTQGQFDALVSFDYNLGMARLRTMLGHGLENVPLQLPRWIHDDHGILPGLVARRAVELSWWNQV